MVKSFIRATCDRCRRYSDFESRDDMGEAGWTVMTYNGAKGPHQASLCPACSEARQLINDAFMKNTSFRLLPDKRKPYHWYIAN